MPDTANPSNALTKPDSSAPPPHSSGSTTVAKPPAQSVTEQLTIKAIDPVPVESTTATTAAPETANAVVEETPSAAARPDAGTDTASPGCAAVTHSFAGSTPVLMADGSTKPIDQIKPGDKITNAVPGQSATQDNTVTDVITTYTDHDFVDLGITPLTDAPTSATASAAAPTDSGTTAKPHSPKPTRLNKAATGITTALAALSGTIATPSAAVHGGTEPHATATTASAAPTAQTGVLTTTFHHPFYDITQATFIDAQNLHLGDKLQTPTGTAQVAAVHLYHANTTTYSPSATCTRTT